MTMNRIRHVLAIGSIGAGAVLAACGGAEGSAPAKAPMAREPDTADQREPTSVAEAQDQIDRARARLAEAADEKRKAEKEIDKDSAHPGAQPGGGAGSSSTTTVKPSTAPAREESAKVAPVDSCTQSCRALSSMRRAVSALCRMTGDTDNRCSDARKTLSESESRVAGCHCSS